MLAVFMSNTAASYSDKQGRKVEKHDVVERERGGWGIFIFPYICFSAFAFASARALLASFSVINFSNFATWARISACLLSNAAWRSSHAAMRRVYLKAESKGWK